MKRIVLPPGFRLELVLSEPIIREPVALTWDGNGRLYVVEMRGYMQDIDGSGARDPVGRISLHEDTDGDGRLDKHTVYMDKLVEPRAILAVKYAGLSNKAFALHASEEEVFEAVVRWCSGRAQQLSADAVLPLTPRR